MFEEYLEETEYVDYSNPNVKELAKTLKEQSEDEISLIKNTYHYVRDKTHHPYDIQDKRVTVSASEVLKEGVGICWAKSNLLAALLRANGIPSGFSYQKLTLGGSPDTGYCIHSLNTVYIPSLKKWIRLDARGNTKDIQAEFSLTEEKLCFKADIKGEIDYHDNHPAPDKKLMRILKENNDAFELCFYNMPDSLEYYE